VNVSNTVKPDIGTTITGATLYYDTTDKTTASAPATDYSTSPTGWTAITMCKVGTTNTYQTASSGSCTSSHIPDLTGKRVWYYIVMTDDDGNRDIQPEPSVGVYTYDQDSRFSTTMSVTRSGGGGQDVALSVTLDDENALSVSGATVSATITDTRTGTVETGTMVEDTQNPGTYTYAATQLYHDKTIDVSLAIKRTSFTDAACGIAGISKNVSVATRICN
jgi:hypothetical protein